MEVYLMPKKLKTHAASFKFKVVLESFTSNNVAETARKYSLNANQLLKKYLDFYAPRAGNALSTGKRW
jgi:transposase-like protein